MRYTDYVTRPDLEFNAWQIVLIALVVTKATAWGIPPEDIADLLASQTLWTTAFSKASNTQTRNSADVREKDNARAAFEKILREFILQWLSFNKKVTDGERESMHLTVRSDVRIPSPVPSTMPIIRIDVSIDQQHSIYFRDTTSTGKAKPDGVYGCEIWIKIGSPAPVNGEGLTFLVVDTKSPHVINFESEDVGKTIYYRVRWINSKGQQGPWSKVVSAIVAG